MRKHQDPFSLFAMPLALPHSGAVEKNFGIRANWEVGHIQKTSVYDFPAFTPKIYRKKRVTKTRMHSWGCATWDGVCANASFSQVKKLKTGAIIFDVVENSCWLRGAGGS